MKRTLRGFTLMELLVSVAIIAVLVSVLLPALNKARDQARTLIGLENQRQTVTAGQQYAMSGRDRLPESVATIGVESAWWNWQEPTVMTGFQARSPRMHRSLSGYLRSYLDDPSVLYCANVPDVYPYLKELWAAGDAWDHPETPPPEDPFTGTVGFFWNYLGVRADGAGVFRGPRSLDGGRDVSTLMVSEYLGFDHWRSPGAYGSCERMDNAVTTPGTLVSASYWSVPQAEAADLADLDVRLHAGFLDGHVEAFRPEDTFPIKVSLTSDGSMPYPDGVGPGVYYLPNAAR